MRRGDTITAYGSGFLARPRRLLVTIQIGDRVVATNIAPDDKGNFKVPLKVTEMAGQYRVTASQTTEAGTVVRDERMLLVPAIDPVKK